MTCKNIRSARALTQPEINPLKQLKWAREVPGMQSTCSEIFLNQLALTHPTIIQTELAMHNMCAHLLSGDFHLMWECLRIVLSCYWGNASTPGSLYNLREIVCRHRVDQKGKVFSIADEFVHHCFHAHLLANICSQLQITSPSDPIPHTNTSDWLLSTAERLLQGSIMPMESTDPLYSMHRSFLYTSFLYCDLRDAIRYEEGSHIIRHWRMWLPIFLGTKCHNYAKEAVNLLANLKADFPYHIAYIVTNNRTVNTEGRSGHGKPIDQMVEHYNL